MLPQTSCWTLPLKVTIHKRTENANERLSYLFHIVYLGLFQKWSMDTRYGGNCL
jgi:hypothetical protein